ncbi:hypothetical protein OnM2_088014 [Erysiphe neolycopersici]|uniref:Uncharacterized protein n=1 Tax=Erysiphe neolycopersici TaxID=212602 RepID=A0A420HDV7_9PEZI|nr:hypothetical protein OnM2_088014 [Erysiphe neolycopersici]
MSLPYLLPPQFLLPSWNLRQLVPLVQIAQVHDTTSLNKSISRKHRRRNFPAKAYNHEELPTSYFRSISRLHSSSRTLSIEREEDNPDASQGIGEAESDDGRGGGGHSSMNIQPRVQYVMSEKLAQRIRMVTVSPKLKNQTIQETTLSSIPRDSESHFNQFNGQETQESKPISQCSDLNTSDNQLVNEGVGKVLQQLQAPNVSHDSNSQSRWVPKKSRNSKKKSLKKIPKNESSQLHGTTNPKNAIQKQPMKNPSVDSGLSSHYNSYLPSQTTITTTATSTLSETSDSRSLFDELFPEELLKQERSRQRRAIVNVETLPIFNWTPMKNKRKKLPLQSFNSLQATNEENKNKDDDTSTVFATNEKTNRTLHSLFHEDMSILCLTGCSNSLEESDFFRIGSKGEHIETWTNGIIKVIPVRDEVTLRCTGSYLILFSSDNSAREYLKQVLRLHKFSRLKNKAESSISPVSTKGLCEGEDLDILLKSFSLVPGYGRLTIKLLRRPYKPRYSQLLRSGGPLGILKHKSMTEHLVLFYLDVGKVTINDLRDFLNHDGKRRNLSWKLAGGYDAIMETQQHEDPEGSVPVTSFKEKKQWLRPSSYVLPFAGEYEARRFVREWHRRQFPLRQQKQSSHDNYISVINAELMW